MTNQNMLEIHRIFSESWRVLIGDGTESPNSALKVLAAKLTQQKNGEVLSVKTQLDGSEQMKLVKKFEQAHTEVHIATWLWSKDKSSFELTVSPNQLTEGFGESLSMLNLQVKCKAWLSESKKISKLSCENLGYGLSRTTHVLFSKFEYNTEADNILIVEADRYENLFHKIGCSSKEACLKMQVPVLGQIKIVDNRKEASEKKSVETLVPIVETVAKAESATTEVKKDAGINEKSSEAISETNNEVNNKIENSGEEDSELAAAGYRSEDLQESGASNGRINPVFLSEGQHSGMHR